MRGGSTRPWAVYVSDSEGKLLRFVVKVFKDEPFQIQPYVMNEVLGTVIAGMFDLSTPKAAFVEFTEDFIQTLPPQQLEQLGRSPLGVKFGCELLDSSYQYSPSLAKRYLEVYDIESIYAFDNLILNRDRNARKPNLLLHPQQSYLIDHELSMEGADHALVELQQGRWPYLYKIHLFHKYLKSRGLEAISQSFHTFGDYLRRANFNELVPYSEQLEELGFDTTHFDSLKRYLCYQNTNSSRFEEFLRRTLL